MTGPESRFEGKPFLSQHGRSIGWPGHVCSPSRTPWV
jgi:hypothetical protein